MQVESYHIINMSRLTQNKYLAGTGVMPDGKKMTNTFFFSYLNLPLENGPVVPLTLVPPGLSKVHGTHLVFVE